MSRSPGFIPAARAATNVYRPAKKFLAGFPEWVTCELFGVAGIEGAIYRDGMAHTTTIAVRGTDMSWVDWARNVAVWTSPLTYDRSRRAHTGYRRAAAVIWPMLTKLLRDAAEDSYIVTGHSAGGAIAEMVADKMLAFGVADRSKLRVITFGAPAVWGWGDEPSIERHRFVMDDDVVPFARLPWLGARQPKYSGCYLIDSDTDEIIEATSEQAVAAHVRRAFKNGIMRGRLFRRLWDGVVAHKMSGYREAINAW